MNDCAKTSKLNLDWSLSSLKPKLFQKLPGLSSTSAHTD